MGDSLIAIPQRLDELVAGLVSRPPLAQAIVVVESLDRSFRWIGASGEGLPLDPEVAADTPFFVASIDKLLNAAVALMLAESGQLSLEAKISTYLSPDLTQGIHRLNGFDYSNQITVRHLLSHTSGLADWLEDRPRKGKSFLEKVLGEGDRAFTFTDIMEAVRLLKPHFAPQDLSRPRQKARYSDTNFILLVAIIEAVTGERLDRVHERLFFQPMAMRHTYFPGASEPLLQSSDPICLRSQGRPLYIPEVIHSVRGINSTVGDLTVFMRSFIRGELFQDPATLELMCSNWNQFGFPLDRAALRAPGWPIEYGLGVMRFRLPGILSPIRPMAAVIGHTGSTGCWLFYCAELELFLVGNVGEVTAGAVPYRAVPKILDIISS